MTALEFVKKIVPMSVETKIKIRNRIEDDIRKGNRTQKVIDDLQAIVRWINMNIFVGDELCPPEHIESFRHAQYSED